MRHLVLASAALVSLILSLGCLRLAKDHVHLAVAQRLFDDNDQADALQRAQAQLDAVGVLTEAKGEYWLLRARIRQQQAVALTGTERIQALTQALREYRLAIHSKPLWPEAWSGSFAVLSSLGWFEQSWQHTLDRALRLGPNEAHVFRDVFPWMLLHWHRLTDEQRDQAFEFAARMAKRYTRWVLVEAQRFGFLVPFCDYFGQDHVANKECRRFGWSAAATQST